MKKCVSVFLFVILVVSAVSAAGFSLRIGSGYMGTFGNTGYFDMEYDPERFITELRPYRMVEHKAKYGVNAYMFDFGLSYELKKIPVFVYADFGFGFPGGYRADGEFFSKRDMESFKIYGPWTFKSLNDFHLNVGAGYSLSLYSCPVKLLMGAGFAMEIMNIGNENKYINVQQRMTNLGLNIRLEGDYMVTDDFAVCLLINPNMMFCNNFRSRLETLSVVKREGDYLNYGARSSNSYFSFALQATVGIKYTF